MALGSRHTVLQLYFFNFSGIQVFPMRVVGGTEHTFLEDDPKLKYEMVTLAMRYLGHGGVLEQQV